MDRVNFLSTNSINTYNTQKRTFLSMTNPSYNNKTLSDYPETKHMQAITQINFRGENNSLAKQAKINASKLTKEVLEARLKAGKTNKEIAEEFKVSKATVLNKKLKFGITSAKRDSQERYAQITAEDIISRLNRGMTAKAIQKELNIPPTSYKRLLNKLGITTKAKQQFEHNQNIDINEIKKRLAQGQPTKQILKELGISKTKWSSIIQEHHIVTQQAIKNQNAKQITKEAIATKLAEGKSVNIIAQELGVSEKVIYTRIHKFGLKLRQPKSTSDDGLNEKIANLLSQGKTPAEIKKKLKISQEVYKYRLNQLQIKSQLEQKQEARQDITKERLQRMVEAGMSATEISKKLNIPRMTISSYLKKFGLQSIQKTEILEKQKITINDITTRLQKGIKQQDICADLGISKSTYYNILAKNGVITDKQQRIKDIMNISKDQLEKLLSQKDNLKDICEEMGISSDTLHRKMLKYNLKPKNLHKTKIEIPKEELVKLVLDGKTINEICEVYDIYPSLCSKWLHKYNLRTKRQMKNIDNSSSNPQELYDKAIDIYFNLSNTSHSSKVDNLMDFLYDKKQYSQDEYTHLQNMVKILEGMKLGAVDKTVLENSKSTSGLIHSKKTAEEAYKNIGLQMSAIFEYIANSKETDSISSICYKYMPEHVHDSKNETAQQIISIIKQDIQGNKNTNLRNLEAKLLYFDETKTNPNSNLIKTATEYAKDTKGNFSDIEAGKYIKATQRAETKNFSSLPFEDTLSQTVNEDTKTPDKNLIKTLIKLEDWNNNDTDKSSLREFLNIFDMTNPTEAKIIKSYIEDIYSNMDTTILAQGKAGTSTANVKQDVIFASKAKKAILDNTKYPKCIDKLSEFENAMQYIVPPKGQNGIKQLTELKNYNWEVKINGEERLLSSDNSFYFDTYSEKGFHKTRKVL